MGFSSIIVSINSALDDVDFLFPNFPPGSFLGNYPFTKQRFRLRTLKTFVLLTRKFGNDVHLRYFDDKHADGNLGSLLIRIDDAVSRNSQKLPPNFLLKDIAAKVESYFRARKNAFHFQRDFLSLKEEIDEWYMAMSDDTRQSNSLTADEVGEITKSILDNLVDFSCFGESLAEPTEALREQMNFLNNFCRFATKRVVEDGQMRDLLTHYEAVAISAAHLCFLCGAETDDREEWRKGMQFKISTLLQNIKPTDPQVCKTYTDALSCSKLSRRLDAPTHIQEMEDDSTFVMKNFIESLLSILWEMLQVDIHLEVSLKDHRQVIYEVLRSLRTILKKHPNSIDEKTRDDIGVVVCDAGILVFSFYQKNVEIDLGLQDLLERIKVFVAEVEEKVLQTSISDSFSMQFDSVREDIEHIKTDASKISYGKKQDIKVVVTSTSSHVLPSRETASITTEVVGFHDEAGSIMNRLLRGSKQLRVVAIVGMGGLGKTTLATKVYNDPLAVHHFHVRAWCPVSQTLDKTTLLLELLKQTHAEIRSENTEETHAEECSKNMEEYLAEKFRKYLKGKRYLIFLDDIWTIEAWNSLQGSFPDDSKGSRIILTSRNHDAAPVAMLDEEPLFLRQLNKEESLELLKRKLFPGKDWPPELYRLGMQIVEKCKGVPLTIVIVAGLLAPTERAGWEEIVDGLSSGVSSRVQCMNSMELSYKHLPDNLKPCFLYFAAFQEDREVSVRRLIRLWIAEELVAKGKWESLEDAAEHYLMDLIGRSLIMVAQQRSMGGVKTCRIHDLLRGFCLRKAKDGHFLHLLKDYDELLAFYEPCNLWRLCIQSEPEHFKESRVFCPRARSLLFFPSRKREWYEREASINNFLIHIFKSITVLDLGEIKLGGVFPSEIELLVQLRYLAIQGRILVIPPWVGNLSMLETFIIVHPLPYGEEVSLPDTIWNLRKLKCLYTDGRGRLPIEDLDNSSVLYELDSLSGVVFFCWGSVEEQMRKFPNIRKLKCTLSWSGDDTEKFLKIGVPDFLERLESLHMIRGEMSLRSQFEFSFPANLKKLTLSRFRLPWCKISTIGELPNLEVLKLLRDSFIGETWEMEEGEFQKLRYLKLSDLDLVRWTGADDQFPCLEKLVLVECRSLEEMPSCLESTPTLEMIEARYCSEATATLTKKIQAEQEKLENPALKILIQPLLPFGG